MWRFRGFPQWQFALLCRRQRWVLTAQGWLIFLLCLTLLVVGSLLQVYPFLAVNHPIQADTLVVEGWVQDQNLQDALTEFRSHPYERLVTTGIPIPRGAFLSEYRTFADLAAATLVKMGMDPERLVVVPAPFIAKDRTYTSALALRQWLKRSNLPIKAINILTLGPHARRSWLLFRKALAPRQVGILASPDPEYDPQRWWASSAGFRSVTAELIAYLYAWVFNISS